MIYDLTKPERARGVPLFFIRARIENKSCLFYNHRVTPPPAFELSSTEKAQLDGLRRGDEAVFKQLVAAYHPAMVRIAQMFVDDHVIAEEVAQEAWLGFLPTLNLQLCFSCALKNRR